MYTPEVTRSFFHLFTKANIPPLLGPSRKIWSPGGVGLGDKLSKAKRCLEEKRKASLSLLACDVEPQFSRQSQVNRKI